MQSKLVHLYNRGRDIRLKTQSPRVKKAFSFLARLMSLAVLVWMVYVAYQQRHILFQALELNHIYFFPFVLCYVVGFILAVISWHVLLQTFGQHYSLLENYVAYAYMSAYRNLPVPYLYFATLFYNYQQKGTGYKTTGFVIVGFSMLYTISGVLVFAALSLSGMTIQHHAMIMLAVIASVLVSVLVHPSIFNRLVRLALPVHQQPDVPTVTWKPLVFLVAINMLVLVCGGGVIFSCARIILDVPLTLLPVCIASWSLVTSTRVMMSWLPSDFGLSQILLIALFQPYVPIAYIVAIFAAFRLFAVILDIANAGIAIALQHIQTNSSSN